MTCFHWKGTFIVPNDSPCQVAYWFCVCLFVCLFVIGRHLFFFNFLLCIFFIYISNGIPKVPYTLPPALLSFPPTPTSWPWHSPVLGHIKFAIPRGLSSQRWLTRPSYEAMPVPGKYRSGCSQSSIGCNTGSLMEDLEKVPKELKGSATL